MKHKALIITTIVFFLIVNTPYFWEDKLGFISFPIFVLLCVVYLVLAFLLLTQLLDAVKERFRDRQRILTITILTAVLILTFLFPTGIVNFEQFESDDLLIAESEGAANCTTTFKLKANNTFTERSICFAVTKTEGDYELKGDTIFFKNIELSRLDSGYYQYALIKRSKFQSAQTMGDLVRYKNKSDTTGQVLWITKNDLQQTKEQKR